MQEATESGVNVAKTSTQTLQGRPRDAALDKKILSAVWDFLGTRPLADLTINEIAKLAGTTRPAIYRRWRTVDEIVIDAFLVAVDARVPTPTDAAPPDALRTYIRSLTSFLGGQVGRVIAELLGRAQTDQALMNRFQDKFLMRRRNHGRQLIRSGQATGHFRADVDCELLIDLYAGPIYFRAFAQHASMDTAFADGLADLVLTALAPDRS